MICSKAARTPAVGPVCPVTSFRGGLGLALGVACVVGVFATTFGVGVGLGGATVRVRVEGDTDESTVDEFEFCANVKLAHEQTIEAMINSLFITGSLDLSHRSAAAPRF